MPGLPALLAYLWFVIVVLKTNLKTIQLESEYQIALLLAVVGYLVQATFNISVIAVAPVFWSLLALNIVVADLKLGKDFG